MSASMAEVLAEHMLVEDDACDCNEMFYDTRLTPQQIKVEHSLHVEERLAANGYGSIRAAAAVGWDAAVGQMVYEDGTPVQVATNDNPYRRPE